MDLKIENNIYDCISFIEGNYHNATIQIKGQLKEKTSNVNISFGEFSGFCYTILPSYNPKENITKFLIYEYQPGDPELELLSIKMEER